MRPRTYLRPDARRPSRPRDLQRLALLLVEHLCRQPLDIQDKRHRARNVHPEEEAVGERTCGNDQRGSAQERAADGW